MIFKSQVLTRIVLLIFCLTMPLNLVSAAWWEGTDLPVPLGAHKEKEETRIIAGSQMDFTYYTSTQDAAGIKEFYRTRLPNLGWQEKNFLKDLSQIQLPQGMPAIDSAYLDKALESNLLFEKGDETLIITFLPQEYSQDGKTRFDLCYGRKTEAKQEVPADTVAVPVLVAKPKKDVFPVYPGASLISLDEEARSLKATYLVKDEPEAVIPFYRTKMSDYGWYFKGEKPLKKMDTNYTGAKDCPSCKGSQAISGAAMETWFGTIDFSNARGDTCNIAIAEVAPINKALSSYKMTTIVVVYREKTQ